MNNVVHELPVPLVSTAELAKGSGHKWELRMELWGSPKASSPQTSAIHPVLCAHKAPEAF